MKRAEPAWALALAVFAAAALASGLLLLPLVWDGSLFLFESVNDGSPVVGLRRLGVALFALPTVAAASVTDDTARLRVIFALSYAFVPFVAVVGSWLVVRRRRPDLMVWPAVGIGAALAQGQAIPYSGTLVAAVLTWPLLLAAAASTNRNVLVIVGGLGLIVALAHPVALALLITVAVVAALARRGRARAAWIVLFALLVAVNLGMLTLQLEPYEVQSAQPLAVAFTLSSEAGPQLAGLALVTMGCWWIALAGRAAPGTRRDGLHRGALLAVAAAAIPLGMWAADGELWREVVGFRIWAMPLTVPLLVIAALDARSNAGRATEDLARARAPIAFAAGGVLLIVTVVQGIGWTAYTTRLAQALEGRHGCVPTADVRDLASSPLDNWAITPLSVVMQGRTVRAFVAETCTTPWPGPIPLPFGVRMAPRWYRFE